MKYRCIGCGMKCTVTVTKGLVPTICVTGNDTADWRLAESVRKDDRMNPVHIERMRDARIKPVVAVDPYGERMRFKSITEASATLGINTGGIARALKNPGYRAGGYGWQYVGRTQDETRLYIAAQEGLEEYMTTLMEIDPERYATLTGGE